METRVLVGMGTCGIAAGARKVMEAFEQGLEGVEGVELLPTGCVGLCEKEVVAEIQKNGEKTIYGDLTPEKVERLIEEVILKGKVIDDWIAARPEEPMLAKQERIVLGNCGHINPENIDEYLERDGYKGLKKVLKDMTPGQVVEEVKTSGLRGRGGGGFPAGLKWQFASQAPGDKKYVVCNADEGDPGAFMDRSIKEGDPHALLEGMLICGYAIGSDEGYVYVRAEYPLAIKRLKVAMKQAEERGYLGENILGTGYNFRIKIKEGAGAFVCGEETALLASIEGRMGRPRSRPPYPATKGLWDKPTNINNVETYANIPRIIRRGGDKFAQIGTEKSTGTKVFALTGKINNTGLIEVPMGISIREIIYDIGGGIPDGREFKAVQIGGPSGGCIPAHLLDLPIDYDSLVESGAIMGSGGLVTMDEETCMVDVAWFFLNFTQKESCGKCTPCREGTKRMLEILERIKAGKGKNEDIERLKFLGRNIVDTSLCGLGQTAPNPVLSTLRFFEDEYRAHIEEHLCPAGVCADLLRYEIVQEDCKRCSICVKVCPVNAISGKPKEKHLIDQELCTKCNACLEKCPFDAIVKK